MDAFMWFKKFVEAEHFPEGTNEYLFERYPDIVYKLEEKQNITAEHALVLLGLRTFSEGVIRATGHCDCVREGGYGEKIYMYDTQYYTELAQNKLPS